MKKNKIRNLLFGLVAISLLYTFRGNPSWVELCSGLAFFLFGMQCMNDGLQQLAGSKLEKILARSTSTKPKGLFFGMLSTMILQSTTVVSLLTIAFISTSLITLAGGFTIMMGAYIGASSGVWLLALAGQGVDLAPFAYPMLVLGVLASFNGDKSKALGRVLLGIAFILLAISLMKSGFSNFTSEVDFTEHSLDGISGVLIFLGIGFLITTVLQSSHATIMLVLTALHLGQVTLEESFILTIGAIWGSSVTTAIVGFLGGSRGGKRLTLAHVLFNFVTGSLALILLKPLTYLVYQIGDALSLNPLIELAVFHTIFNLLGVSIFWGLQDKLITKLMIWIPDEKKQTALIADAMEKESAAEPNEKVITSRYLNPNVLSSPATAVGAIFQEIEHLGQMSVEVICLSLNLPIEELGTEEFNEGLIRKGMGDAPLDANKLYQRYVKGIYSEILSFMSRIQFDDEEESAYYQEHLLNCQMIALKLVDSVKNSHQLQDNFSRYSALSESDVRNFYQQLKIYLFKNIREIYRLYQILEKEGITAELKHENLAEIERLIEKSKQFERVFRREIFMAVRKDEIDGFSTSSLMNDLNYSRRIVKSLYDILALAFESQYRPFIHDEPEETEDDASALSNLKETLDEVLNDEANENVPSNLAPVDNAASIAESDDAEDPEELPPIKLISDEVCLPEQKA